jgi:hypothetical protein
MKHDNSDSLSNNSIIVKDIGALTSECIFLYKCMFGRPPSGQFMQHYLDAHCARPELCSSSYLENATLQKLQAKNLNAVCIEPWLRRINQNHPLTAKLLLITYIAECDSRHPEFNRNTKGCLLGKCQLLLELVRGAVQLFYGYILVKLYGLH